MLRHPSRHYIYYLFSKRSLDVPAIILRLRELHLPVPTVEESLIDFTKNLYAERKRMRFPAGFDPRNPNEGTTTFLKRWKIRGMWGPDRFVSGATDMLLEPTIRRMLEVMLLGPLSIADIAKRARNRFGLDQATMNTRVVQQFMHYYWDYGALSTEEWREMLYRWLSGYNNDMLMALNAPRTQAGAALTVSAADRGGSQSLNSVTMYSAIRDQGFRMFMSHALNDAPGLHRTQGALFALNIITQSEEELDKRRGGSAELLEELNKIETVYDHQPLISVTDLPSVRASLPAVIDTEGEDVTDTEETA